MEAQARARVAASEVLNQHATTIFYDWPNWDEHMEWVATADESEIVDWAADIQDEYTLEVEGERQWIQYMG